MPKVINKFFFWNLTLKKILIPWDKQTQIRLDSLLSCIKAKEVKGKGEEDDMPHGATHVRKVNFAASPHP